PSDGSKRAAQPIPLRNNVAGGRRASPDAVPFPRAPIVVESLRPRARVHRAPPRRVEYHRKYPTSSTAPDLPPEANPAKFRLVVRPCRNRPHRRRTIFV